MPHMVPCRHSQSMSSSWCLFCCTAGAGPKQGKNNKQSLFLIYLDAASIVNNKRAVKQPDQSLTTDSAGCSSFGCGQQQQAQLALASLPPNVPDFSVRDLQFILTLTGIWVACSNLCAAYVYPVILLVTVGSVSIILSTGRQPKFHLKGVVSSLYPLECNKSLPECVSSLASHGHHHTVLQLLIDVTCLAYWVLLLSAPYLATCACFK